MNSGNKKSDAVEKVIELSIEVNRLEADRTAEYARYILPIDKQISALKERIAHLMGNPGAAVEEADSEGLVASWCTRFSKKQPKTELAMRHIISNPKADYETLVVALYKENTTGNVFKARSVVSTMKGRSILEGDPGSWKILEPPEGDAG